MSDSKLNFATKVLPPGYQIISEEAIAWLFENHPEAYQGFYERVRGLTPLAPDVCKSCGTHFIVSGEVKPWEFCPVCGTRR